MTDCQVTYKFYIIDIHSEKMAAKFNVKGACNSGQEAQEYGRSWAFNHCITKGDGLRAACEITVSDINKHPNHCVMIMVYT
jgi:hypothetical protein